jgi:hypothetical protein
MRCGLSAQSDLVASHAAAEPSLQAQECWSRFLDPAEPVHAVLAVSGEDTLGFAHSLYHRSTWTAGDYCYLQDLFVADEARGRGVGRILIEHVYADAKRQGAARVYWSTHQSNHNAMLLYDRIAERSEFIQYRKQLP